MPDGEEKILSPERTKQLEENANLMLQNGYSDSDIQAMSNQFIQEYGTVKKKELTTSASPVSTSFYEQKYKPSEPSVTPTTSTSGGEELKPKKKPSRIINNVFQANDVLARDFLMEKTYSMKGLAAMKKEQQDPYSLQGINDRNPQRDAVNLSSPDFVNEANSKLRDLQQDPDKLREYRERKKKEFTDRANALKKAKDVSTASRYTLGMVAGGEQLDDAAKQQIDEELAASDEYLKELNGAIAQQGAVAIVQKRLKEGKPLDRQEIGKEFSYLMGKAYKTEDKMLSEMDAPKTETITDPQTGMEITLKREYLPEDKDKVRQEIEFDRYKTGSEAVAYYWQNAALTAKKAGDEVAFQNAMNEFEKASLDVKTAVDKFPQVKRKQLKQTYNDVFFQRLQERESKDWDESGVVGKVGNAIHRLGKWFLGEEPNDEDIEYIAKQTGTSVKQVKEIVEEGGWWDRNAVGAKGFLSGIATGMDEMNIGTLQGVRRMAGGDAASVNNRISQIGLEDRNMRAAGNKLMDDFGKFNFNPYAIFNAGGSGLGQTAALAVPAMITGGLAAEGTLAAKVLEGGATVGAAFPSGFEQGWKVADQYTDDENVKNAYGVYIGLITGFPELIGSPASQIRKFIGADRTAKQVLFKEFQNEVSELGIQKALQNKIATTVKDITKKVGKGAGVIGQEILEEEITEAGTMGGEALVFDKPFTVNEVIDNFYKTAVATAITTLPLGIGAGISAKGTGQLRRDALFEAGNEPDYIKAELERQKAEGIISEPDFNKSMQVVNTMQGIVAALPKEQNGRTLTVNQKKKLAVEQFRILNNKQLEGKVLEAEKPLLEADTKEAIEAQAKVLGDEPYYEKDGVEITKDKAIEYLQKGDTDAMVIHGDEELQLQLEQRGGTTTEDVEVIEEPTLPTLETEEANKIIQGKGLATLKAIAKSPKISENDKKKLNEYIAQKEKFDAQPPMVETKEAPKEAGTPEQISQPIELSTEITDTNAQTQEEANKPIIQTNEGGTVVDESQSSKESSPAKEVVGETVQPTAEKQVDIYEYKGKQYEVSSNSITEVGTDNARPLEFRDEVVSKGTKIAKPTEQEVEDKKSDIERRRQEELKNTAEPREATKVETYEAENMNTGEKQLVQIRITKDGKKEIFVQGEGIQEGRLVWKSLGDKYSDQVSNETLLQFVENPKLIKTQNEQEFLEEQKSTFKGKTVREKINAKYDAELKALEQPNSELEAKKADIERRRQEELKKFETSEVKTEFYNIPVFLDSNAKVRGDKQEYISREVFDLAYANDNREGAGFQTAETLIRRGGYTKGELTKGPQALLKPEIDKINAKYDAELAALEQTKPTEQEVTTPTVSGEGSGVGVGGDVEIKYGGKDKDLKGNPQKQWMKPTETSEQATNRLAEFVEASDYKGREQSAFIDRKGESVEVKLRNDDGKWNWYEPKSKKPFASFDNAKDAIKFIQEQPFWDNGELNKNGRNDAYFAKVKADHIKTELENGNILEDINDGKILAKDAAKIIESAGLKVPKDIADQSLKETTKEGGGVGGDVEATAKTITERLSKQQDDLIQSVYDRYEGEEASKKIKELFASKEYKDIEEQINQLNPVGADLSGFEKTLSESDAKDYAKYREIGYRLVAADKENGYKPFKVTESEKKQYAELRKRFDSMFADYSKNVDAENTKTKSKAVEQSLKETPKSETPTPTQESNVVEGSVGVGGDVVKGETKVVNGRELTLYNIKGRDGGSGFAVEKGSDGYVIHSAMIPMGIQRQGIGTRFYVRMNEESVKNTGNPLRSSDRLSNSAGKPFWENLVKNGYAEKTGDGYIFKSQQTLTEKQKLDKEKLASLTGKKMTDAEFLDYEKRVADRIKSNQQKQFTYREIEDIAKKVKGGTVAGAKAESGGGYTTIFFHKYTDADAAISKLRKEGYNVSDRQNNPTNAYTKFKITVEKAVEQSLKAEDKAPVTKPEGKSDVVDKASNVGGDVESKKKELEIERDNKLAEIKDENVPENKKTELDNQISDKQKKQAELDKKIADTEKQVDDTISNLDKASKEHNELADQILVDEPLTNQEREIANSEKANGDTVEQHIKKSFRQYLKGLYNGGLVDFFKKIKDKLRKALLVVNMSAIMASHTAGDFSFNQYVDLAKNYSERHMEVKPDSQLQTVTLKVSNNKLEDNLGVNKIPYKSGYATNQIINLEGNTFEARNRADVTPVQNAVGITTNLFKPFQEVANFKGVLPRASDSVKQNPPVIAFNKKTGNVKVGNLKDFNNDWLVSETFTIPLDFKTDANGQIKTVYHGQAERNVPVTTVNGKDIPFPIGLDTKDKTIDPIKHNTFGVLEGGKVILSVGNYQVQVNGGFADIYSAWKELKSKNPNKEITAYLLDNGSYNLPILKDDGVVTSEDLTKQTLRNKDGGTSLVLKQKIPQEAANYPHGYQKIETNNFRKDSTGNKVENKPTAIVLHHTGEYKGGEKDVIKEFTAPKGNSSHYLIGKDGKIYQFNDGSYVMYHAGESLFKGKEDLNSSSIGIEIQGDSQIGDFTKEQYESLTTLVYQLAKNYNIPIENIVDHKTIRDNYLKAHPEDKATKEKVDLNDMVMKHIVKELQKAYPKIEQQQREQHDTTTEKGKSEMPVSTPLEVLGALQGLDLAIRAYRRRKANKASEKNIEPDQPNVATSTKKLINNPAKEVALSKIEDLQKSLDSQKAALEDLRKDKSVNQSDIDNFQKQINELTEKSNEVLSKNNANKNARDKIKKDYDAKIKAVEQSLKETTKSETPTPTQESNVVEGSGDVRNKSLMPVEEIVKKGFSFNGSDKGLIEALESRKGDNAIHAKIFQSNGYNVFIYDNNGTLVDKKFKTHEEAKIFLNDWADKNGKKNQEKYDYNTITDVAGFPYRAEVSGSLPKDFVDKYFKAQPKIEGSVQVDKGEEKVAEKDFAGNGLFRADAKKTHQRAATALTENPPTDAYGLALQYISGGGKVVAESIDEIAGSSGNALRLNIDKTKKRSNEARSKEFVATAKDIQAAKEKGKDLTLDGIVHSIWDNLSEEMQNQVSDRDLKDALMEVINETNTRLEASQKVVELFDADYKAEQYYKKLAEEQEEMFLEEQERIAALFADQLEEEILALASEEHINNLINQYENETELNAENQQLEPTSETETNQPISSRTNREKTQSKEDTEQKSLADKARALKVDLSKLSGGGLQSNPLGLPIGVWNSAMDLIANVIEGGGTVADAIKRGLNYIQKNHRGQWDKKGFNDQVMKELGVRGITVNGEDFIVKNDAKTEREFAQTVNGWYSDLEQSVLDIKGEKGSGEQWKKALGNSDEAKWTGLNDWLSQQKGQVSKKDIQNYLKDNRIEIVEVVKSDEPIKESKEYIDLNNQTVDAFMKVNEARNKWYETKEDKDFDEIEKRQKEANKLSEKLSKLEKQERNPISKFSQYQLEGEKEGGSYKEILVTLPNKEVNISDFVDKNSEYIIEAFKKSGKLKVICP